MKITDLSIDKLREWIADLAVFMDRCEFTYSSRLALKAELLDAYEAALEREETPCQG